jgi:membrane-associated protein
VNEGNLADLFVAGMTTYGPWALGVASLLAPLGIPIPLPLLALAAGAFARQGMLNGALALVLGLSAAAFSDSVGYAVGRFARPWVERRFGGSSTWRKARDRFHRDGGLAIYITRWLLSPLALPTNLVAGGSGYPYRKFLAFTVTGILTFFLIFGGLGFAFSKQWQAVGEFISTHLAWVVAATVVAVGLYLLIRRLMRKEDRGDPRSIT